MPQRPNANLPCCVVLEATEPGYLLLRPQVILTAVVALLCALSAHSQYWMQKGGSVTIDEAYDIAVDSAGNTYSIGYFTGSATFGATTETSNGSTDIFVVKTDASGNIEWFARAGGSQGDRGLAIEVDTGGNSFVTGYFSGTASFGSTSLTSAGSQDIFIAKLDNLGNWVWAHRAGGTAADQGNGISVDPFGSVVVTGEFRGNADFGATTLTSLGGSADVFIVKLGTGGNYHWTQQGAGQNTDRGLAVSTDAAGNVYATGQFSENITFDVLHNNLMFNVSYVIQLDSSGAEQWFRIIGGGTSHICNAITTSPQGFSYLTGNFVGNLTFFGAGTATINTTYANGIFLCRYSPGGTLSWATAHGSDSEISSQDIEIDSMGDPAIAGYFECTLDEYAAVYGSGTFNSVGHSDVFVSVFDSAGTWDYSRNTGGVRPDYAYGLDRDAAGRLHIAGSFMDKMNFPVSGDFIASNLALWTGDSCAVNNGYCGDPFYGTFYSYNSAGNADALIANCFDPNREPYDFYLRLTSGCNREKLTPCIGTNCPDTMFFCQPGVPTANPMQCTTAGQLFSYEWNSSPLDSNDAVNMVLDGLNVLEIETNDQCLSMLDSVIYIPEVKPRISDNKGVNNMALNAFDINLCNPDSVQLTGFPMGLSVYSWSGPGISGTLPDSVVQVTVGGLYTFRYTDSLGCENENNISIGFQDSLPDFDLELSYQDTVVLCEGEDFLIWLYDSVANPAGNELCFNILSYTVITTMSITPSAFMFEACQSKAVITPQDSTTYTFSAEVVRTNACESDTLTISREIFVSLSLAPPTPALTLDLTGNNYYCPGDSIVLNSSGNGSKEWSGPGVTGLTTDSVYVSNEGMFIVYSEISDTSANGCISDTSMSLDICVREKPQPSVTAASTVLCPNDSILLTANQQLPGPNPCPLFATSGPFFQWFGPNGQISGVSTTAYASEPGNYYAIYNDGDSCALVSNTVTINQYTTPSLAINGTPVLCEGDSLVLSVVADTGSVIEWQPPLSGSETSKTIYTSGVYTCKILSCNIEASVSIEVFDSEVEAIITSTGPLCLDSNTTLIGSQGQNTYSWNPNGETNDSLTITSPGTYTLTTTDTNGCQAISDPFVVTMDQVPTILNVLGDLNFCSGDTVELTSNDSMASYIWSPNGETGQSIQVFEPGTFSVRTVDSLGCIGLSDTVSLDTLTSWAGILIDGPLTFCEGDFVTLSSARTAGISSYLWSPINDTNTSITVLSSGSFTLTTEDTASCRATSAPIDVIVQPKDVPAPEVRDTSFCNGTSGLLKPLNEMSGDVRWIREDDTTNIFTGTSFETEVLTSTTVYYVWHDLGLCQSEPVPLVVDVLDCKSVSVPNVFTPNGDGINDIFRTELEEHECFRCTIFNRWGQSVFETRGFDPGWDGTVSATGNQAPTGTYFYVVEYCRYDGEVVEYRGNVSLIRD